MRFYLLQTKLNGIKSIDKEITIEYYNNTISDDIDIMDNHVKAIYGPNGAGKTGIVYGMQIYKNFFLGSSYLTIENASGVLKSLINQKNKRLSIENIFAVIDDNNKCESIYKHRIVLGSITGERYELENEYFGKLVGNKINLVDKYNTIFEVQNGEIKALSKKIKSRDKIIEVTKNNLRMKSFLASIAEGKFNDFSDEFFNNISYTLISFVVSVRVVLQDSDRPNYIDINKIKSSLEKIRRIQAVMNNEELFSQVFTTNKIVDNAYDLVPKIEYPKYQEHIKRVTGFVKVFTDDLVEIELKPYENGDNYECENIMVYSDGRRINKKFESTGIKKIIDTYDAIADVEKGGIVFYDEFDANLHDVLLVKLVEYIMDYSKGQFIFTTHNMAPMDMLQQKKHGIDFLSSDSKLVSWKKNGNYKASSLYRGGFIESSPFNIEAFDFLGKFGSDNE